MSVLSDQDVIGEVGRNLLIYPFKEASLQGDCLAVTASDYAYSIEQRKLVDIQTDPVKPKKRFFSVPKKETVLVWTNECLWLSNSFCGSIHSRVKLVSKGIGHHGTRVNPNWAGILCITLQNLSNADIQISIGEVIAYLRFYKLSSKSLTPRNLDEPARLDVLPDGCPVPDKLREWIYSENRWRRGNEDTLRKLLNKSTDYQEVKKTFQQKSRRYQIELFLKRWTPPLVVAALILVYLWINKINPDLGKLILVLIPIATAIAIETTKNSR